MDINTIQPINLVCPKCHKQDIQTIDYAAIGRQSCNCQFCKTAFAVQLSTIRSKSSRANKKQFKNFHSVRVYLPNNQEQLLNFETPYQTPLELKSGDNVILTYLNDTLCIVENKTINQYTVIKDVRGCRQLVASLILFLVIASIFAMRL